MSRPAAEPLAARVRSLLAHIAADGQLPLSTAQARHSGLPIHHAITGGLVTVDHTTACLVITDRGIAALTLEA